MVPSTCTLLILHGGVGKIVGTCGSVWVCKCSRMPGCMFVYVKTLIAYKQGHCLYTCTVVIVV